jgi:formylglycine-generating enzyme required for sulfatase activity
MSRALQRRRYRKIAARVGLAFACAGAVVIAARAETPDDPKKVADASATTKAEMKPYTETIANTAVRFKMVPIPGGTFMMGSPVGEAGRSDDEGPQHEVQIEPFWMEEHEVTWNEYENWSLKLDIELRKSNRERVSELDRLADGVTRPTLPYTDMSYGMGKDGYPAISMTQVAAKTYCEWLSHKTGRYYRLPTEAEWEYACRAGSKTAYSFGDDPRKLGEYAWSLENSRNGKPDNGYQKVALKKPNAWGLCDMHGNVAEWTLDQYIPDFYRQFAGKTAAGPLAVPTKLYPRAVRGGSFLDEADRLRSAARRGSNRDWKEQDPEIP